MLNDTMGQEHNSETHMSPGPQSIIIINRSLLQKDNTV